MNSNKPEIVYQYIVEFKTKFDGNSPSIREIAEACNISSTSMVYWYLDKLMEKGLIERTEELARTKIMVKGGSWRLDL